jgi:deoxycytidylate deaminase
MIYEPIELYEICLALARRSACKKLGYGAVLLHRDNSQQYSLVAQASNSPLMPLADLCTKECIRLKIKSGTDSMIGSCAHAEELCLWSAMRDGVRDLRSCELFVQGAKPDSSPIILGKDGFYCIRCATQMYLAGIRGVNVWTAEGHWHFIPSKLAIEQAKLYATRALETAT